MGIFSGEDRNKKSEVFDVCELKRNWDGIKDWNSLTEKWSWVINFIKPPYSECAPFLRKGKVEFVRGKITYFLFQACQPIRCGAKRTLKTSPIADRLIELHFKFD